MTPERTQQLFEDFPRLYRGRSKPVQESMMAAGFNCGDGWFALIWALSQAIEDTARLDGLDPCGEAWPEAVQVKQKCGALRFRLRGMSPRVESLIRDAEADSESVCEDCGASARRVDGSGLRTRCAAHGNRMSEAGQWPE